jgi:trimethylamine---corrinoid protein Co-methyltransferase
MERAGRAQSSARRRRSESTGTVAQLPWRQVRNPYAPAELLSADQIEAIHNASLQVLEEIGVNVLLPEAREIYRQAGADLDPNSTRVRFDRALIEASVAKAPSRFTLHARNPARNLIFGDNYANFATVAGAPNLSDLDGGRRSGTLADMGNFIRLAHSLNIIHLIACYPVEPIDIEPNLRHLRATQLVATLTDKAFSGYALGRRRILDVIEMARIVRGVADEQLDREPSLYTVVNSNSPLQLDRPMLWGIIAMARRNQVVVLTPFTLAGAMAPITLAGALAQQNAEALAGIALSQIVRPGAPVIYGGFTSNVDMRSGAPAFGTPEATKAAQIGGQLARRYRLPYRSSNVNAANAPDVQAAYESQMSIWGALTGHCNLLIHAAGWLEGGLCASFEKFIIDAEMLQMMQAYFEPLVVDEATLGLAAMHEVGPGGHFFGAQHTLERYETAFYAPLLSDWRSFQAWSTDGSIDTTHRANRIYRKLLQDYQPQPLDPAVAEELDAFVRRRTEEGGAPMD